MSDRAPAQDPVRQLFRESDFQADLALLTQALERESAVIGHRMTWLMTLNGLILAALGVLLSSHDKIVDAHDLDAATWHRLVTILAAAGLASNLATLYSNFWAERAIQGADAAFMNVVVRGHDLTTVRSAMRLAGRDPANGPRQLEGSEEWLPGAFFRPAAKLLHPWFSLPLLFIVGFACVPATLQEAGSRWFMGYAPVGIVLVPFIVLCWLSHRGELFLSWRQRKKWKKQRW